MQTFDCQLVSAKDPDFSATISLDFVPRIGDLISERGRAYRVLDVYVVLSHHALGSDHIYLSVKPVAIPQVFSKAQREDVSDEQS